MDINNLIMLVVALIGGGGIATGIAVLVKLRPEAGQITVATAQDVLEMQSKILLQLKTDLEECRKHCHTELAEAKEEYTRLLDISGKEVSILRMEVASLKKQLAQVAGS
jgi:hypothetical protein